MADLFISYSRRDADFVRRLHASLLTSQRDVWVDFEDIPLSADWWEEITRNIEAADTVVFVISPDSLASPICHLELDHAVLHNKRLVPIIRTLTDEKTMLAALARRSLDETVQTRLGSRDLLVLARANWQAISRHNWLFFSDETQFDATFATLIKVLDTDLAYVRRHTRLLVKAREWQERARQTAYLLNSGEISEYSAWVREGATKDPRPTELQLEYLFVSQRAANRRQAITYISMMVALVVTSVLIALSYLQNQRIQEGELTRIVIQEQSLAQAATANAQALILTEQRATGEANLLLVTAQAATNIARQTAVVQDLGERLETAQAGFVFLTQQARTVATSTAIAATLDALVAANTEVVATLNFFQQAATLLALPPTQDITAQIEPPEINLPTAAATWTTFPTTALPTASPAPTVSVAASPTLIALDGEIRVETVLYVSPNGDDDSACDRADSPCRTLDAALRKAPPDATINVDYGIYDETLIVRQPVTLIGADRDLTILTGGQRTTTLVIAPQGRLDVRNLTITGGSGVNGGGIRNEGTLVARNIALTGNTSTDNGGGLANFGSAALLNSTISNNLGANGGGVYNAFVATYASDSQTTTANNTARVNAEGNNTYNDSCPAEVIRDLADATSVCDGFTNGEACLVRGTVRAVNSADVAFSAPADRLSLATVTDLVFSTASDASQRSAVLINLSPDSETPPTRLAYVRGTAPLPPADMPLVRGGLALTIPGFQESLNIRTEPTTRADIITGVFSGLIVSVLDGPIEADGYQWWYIRLPNGTVGWAVAATTEQQTLLALPLAAVRVGGTYTVYGAGSRGINLREQPSTTSPMRVTLRQGRDVVVLDGPVQSEGFDWWYVVSTAANEQGWVAGRVDDQQTLLPVTSRRAYVPEVYLLEDGLCTYSDQNPLRIETAAGTLRIGLTSP